MYGVTRVAIDCWINEFLACDVTIPSSLSILISANCNSGAGLGKLVLSAQLLKSTYYALPRNTKYLNRDGNIGFNRQLFAGPVKLQGCISQL